MNLQLFCDFSARYLAPGSQLSTENLTIPEALHHKWDGYLIEEAAVQSGPGILLSDLVITRVWAWAYGDRKGISKLARFLKNIEKSARVKVKRGAKGKVTDQDRHALRDIVPELKQLQIRLRQEWPESPTEIITFAAREIEASPKMWRLKKNLPHVLNLLGQHGVAQEFRGDNPDHITLTPTQFFIKWLAASKNRSEKSVRADLYPPREKQIG
jgi:hypothetical protein